MTRESGNMVTSQASHPLVPIRPTKRQAGTCPTLVVGSQNTSNVPIDFRFAGQPANNFTSAVAGPPFDLNAQMFKRSDSSPRRPAATVTLGSSRLSRSDTIQPTLTQLRVHQTLNFQQRAAALGHMASVHGLYVATTSQLVLANDGTAIEKVGFVLSRWNGQDGGRAFVESKSLAPLNLSGVLRRSCDKELKPKTNAVQNAPPLDYRVVVLSDGFSIDARPP